MSLLTRFYLSLCLSDRAGGRETKQGVRVLMLALSTHFFFLQLFPALFSTSDLALCSSGVATGLGEKVWSAPCVHILSLSTTLFRLDSAWKQRSDSKKLTVYQKQEV
jgi:hypothetical protein